MQLTEADIEGFQKDLDRLREALADVAIGQDQVVSELIIALCTGGHVLIEGMPGLGKTQLVKGLSNAVGLQLGRVQCTPDLMPGDIVGSEFMHHTDRSAPVALEFRPGPVFAPLVLVDEINRATPKTQAALLEAMQERQVTVGGKAHRLPLPFWVAATQNPIELEGTFPLPEAQLDRFLFKITISLPSREALERLVVATIDDEPAARVPQVLSAARLDELGQHAAKVVIGDAVRAAATDLVLATHDRASHGEGAPLLAGVSPRGLQALLRAARVRALWQGRAHVSRGDLKALALPTFRHRILLSMESELAGIDPDAALENIISAWQAEQNEWSRSA